MCKPVRKSLVHRQNSKEVKVLEYFTLLMCLKDLEDKGIEKEKSEDMEKSLDCPLCLEPLEMDDKNFYPCTCDYQVCRFCWHRIKTTENGLCPACRRIYPENPANFMPVSPEEFQQYKLQKKLKDQQKKHKIAESRKQLANIRVIQKNLVFAVGLPLELSQNAEKKDKVLHMFRQFGHTQKETITDRTNYAGAQGPSACVYITYQKPEDAVRAVKSLTNTKIDGRTIKVSLGTTKYCSNFLKGVQCPKAECLYLHELADEEASFTKEDIHLGKHLEYEMKLLEQTSNSSHNKHSVPNSETNCVNHNHNIDEGSESSDDLHQNNSFDSSDVSDLSPSSNQTLHNIRNIGSSVNAESDCNHQMVHSGNLELRTNSDTPPKSIFRSEENIIINNSNFQDTMHPSFSNQMQQQENESLQQPNFLNNQIFESASRGQSSSKESNLLRLLSTAILESGQKKQVQDGLNMKYEQVETRCKRDDDPDLEFDPCQESLKGLQDLLLSEAKERARIQYNALNRSPLSNRSPISLLQPFENLAVRGPVFHQKITRDPPPGFSNNCTQNVHYKPPYENATSLLNKSPLPLHNQLGGIRTNFSLQRYPQPGVSLNNSFIPEYTSNLQAREIPEYISPVLQQHNQRLMNLSQVQYPITEQRSSPSWNNSSPSQWRPMENMFFNQTVTENRATNDFNLRVPLRSNDTTIRQFQHFPGNVSNLSFPDHPPMTPEQVAKVQVYKAVEAAQRNSPSFGHRLQYTKKL